jgi:hypothetical protein
MKAIYEVKFLDKKRPDVNSDTRRIAQEASTKGFKRAVAWAESVCGEDEFIGSITLTACEKP